MRARAELAMAREDARDWVRQRRERTRQLIELGGLVQKAGLVELASDDRAALLGGLLHLADCLAGQDRAGVLALWRHRGRRAFTMTAKDPKPET